MASVAFDNVESRAKTNLFGNSQLQLQNALVCNVRLRLFEAIRARDNPSTGC